MENPFWTMKYQQMIKEVPKNKAEETALKMLNQGAGILEAQMAAGLGYDEFNDLMKRADIFEREGLCVILKRTD